jgi:S-formylglutathione hydrolase FrmB
MRTLFFLCFLYLLHILYFAPATFAAGRVECAAVESKLMARAVRYCALLPPSYDAPASRGRRYPVVYYLHGLGDNEQSLIHLGGWNMIENLQERGRIGEMIVVVPDAGRSFYVNSRDTRQPYEDFFFREFLPAIERQYRIRRKRSARALLGISMGGYGALRYAFSRPQMFAAVAAHMPALIETIPAGMTDARMLGPRFGFLNDVFGRPFDRAMWERASPFTLLRNAGSLNGLKIYMDCGRSDEYGFDAGTQALSRALTARKIPHEAHIRPGGHNWIFVGEHLDKSLEFVSRALGIKAEGSTKQKQPGRLAEGPGRPGLSHPPPQLWARLALRGK